MPMAFDVSLVGLTADPSSHGPGMVSRVEIS
jgi:hypothetical protein